MKTKEFLNSLEEQKIVAAIAKAEQQSAGEIRLYVSHLRHEDVLAAAQKRFAKLGMTKTRHRNAVLIYFVPLEHKFAIIGDIAVHEKCGQEFWDKIIAQMTPFLKEGRYTEALVQGIERVG